MRPSAVELAQNKTWDFPLNLTEPDEPKFLKQQSEFFHDFQHRFQAYGGGLGQGKTSAGCAKAFFLSTMIPGNRGFIGRWDGKELRQTTMSEFRDLVPDWMFEKNSDQLGYIKFKKEYGGSEIFYGDLKEARGIKNINLGWFWIDQAEEVDAERFQLLVSRLRKQTLLRGQDGKALTRPDGSSVYAPTYGFVTFNPEGTNSFIWRFFHPDSKEKQPAYHIYEAKTYDGLAAGFITQEYVDAMVAIFPEQARKRYLEGAWDVFEGRVFPDFNVEQHVIDPITLQPHWKYYVSIDHGLTNPTSAGVWAVTERGHCLRVAEHYEGGGKPVSYHAACIKNLVSQMGFPVANYYLDPACWAKNQTNGARVYSIADEYNEHGIYPVPGQNNWEAGFNRLQEAITIKPNLPHPVTNLPGSPTLLIFSTCQASIKEWLNYRWKKAARGAVQRNAPDEPIDSNDHSIDEARYFFTARPSHPVSEAVVKPTTLDLIHQQMRAWNPLADVRHVGSWMSA